MENIILLFSCMLVLAGLGAGVAHIAKGRDTEQFNAVRDAYKDAPPHVREMVEDIIDALSL